MRMYKWELVTKISVSLACCVACGVTLACRMSHMQTSVGAQLCYITVLHLLLPKPFSNIYLRTYVIFTRVTSVLFIYIYAVYVISLVIIFIYKLNDD